jgi:predicted RNA-binding protein
MVKTTYLLLCAVLAGISNAFIVNHTCTDLRQVPQTAIEQAKASLHIAYGHTSHGSQLTEGMSALVAFANGGGLGLSLPTNIFAWNNGGSGGALDLHDYAMASDVGYYPGWVNETITYLNNPLNADVNVIIWSWCGQASAYTQQQMIDSYLTPMSQLEITYPNVKFVYMTGHLDGTGQSGTLNLRNQQIRDYCIANNKTLYDFADIESYDPDGLVHYMPLLCNDNCDYDSDGNGNLDKNWAVSWQNSHTINVDWYACSAVHSQSLNGNRKAYAAWWLWSRLGGWNPAPCSAAPSGLAADYNATSHQITLTWTDNSNSPQEDSFVIQRQVDSGSWNTNYAAVGQNITSFVETLLADGTYHYRVATYMADNDQGSPCTSSPSTIVTVIRSTTPPAAPSNLQSTLIGDNDIQLTWADNSSNEQVFVLERNVDGGTFAVLNDAIAQNTTTFMDENTAAPHTYQYRLAARNSYGDSVYSNTATIEVGVLAPAAPSSLQSTLSGSTNIQLLWTDNSSNEQVFVLERSIDSGLFNVLSDTIAANTQIYSDQNVATQHTYSYRIKARNASGDSGYSNAATINVGVFVPATPSSFQSTLSGGNNIPLTWIDNSDNEQYFVLERSIDSGVFNVLSSTIVPNTQTYTDQDVATQHTYGYRIKARNTSGDSGYSNTASQNVPYATYTLNLQTTTDIDDSFISAGAPTTNYGSNGWAPSNLNNTMRYITKYNFPASLNSKRILNANLNIYWWSQSGSWQSGLYMQLYRVTQNWAETSVTWNNASAGIAWTTAGGVYSEPVGQVLIGNVDHAYYVPADVTGIVRRWVRGEVPNYGFIMMNTNSFTSNIKASEYNPMSYLSVTYTDACPCDYSADFNYDCKVDSIDFCQMSRNWGTALDEYDIAPAEGDGAIDILDVQELTGQWLSGCQ